MFERKVTVQLIDFRDRDGKVTVTFGIHRGSDNTYSTRLEYEGDPEQARGVDDIVSLAKLDLQRKIEDVLELLSHSVWDPISGSFEYKPPNSMDGS